MLMGISLLDWLKPPMTTQPIGLADEALYPRPDVTLTPQPLIPVELEGMIGVEPDVTLTPQPVEEKIMENNAWYKEKWATDLMGIIAKEVFKKPVEPAVVSSQQPDKTTDLGAKIEFGDWTLVVSIISIVALILLFFFMKKGNKERAY